MTPIEKLNAALDSQKNKTPMKVMTYANHHANINQGVVTDVLVLLEPLDGSSPVQIPHHQVYSITPLVAAPVPSVASWEKPAEAKVEQVACDCCTWGITDWTAHGFGNGHHVNCEHFIPYVGATKIIKDLVKGIRFWASQEDGVPDEIWDAFKRAVWVTKGKILADDDRTVTEEDGQPDAPATDWQARATTAESRVKELEADRERADLALKNYSHDIQVLLSDRRDRPEFNRGAVWEKLVETKERVKELEQQLASRVIAGEDEVKAWESPYGDAWVKIGHQIWYRIDTRPWLESVYSNESRLVEEASPTPILDPSRLAALADEVRKAMQTK